MPSFYGCHPFTVYDYAWDGTISPVPFVQGVNEAVCQHSLALQRQIEG